MHPVLAPRTVRARKKAFTFTTGGISRGSRLLIRRRRLMRRVCSLLYCRGLELCCNEACGSFLEERARVAVVEWCPLPAQSMHLRRMLCIGLTITRLSPAGIADGVTLPTANCVSACATGIGRPCVCPSTMGILMLTHGSSPPVVLVGAILY